MKLTQYGCGVGAAVGLLSVAPASACPCSDDPGSGDFMTRREQRYALALAKSSRRSLGSFDARGNFRALSDTESETSEELLLRAALRAPERFEWQFEAGAAAYRFHSVGHWQRQQGPGDALVRALYAARDQAMPHESLPWPALSLALSVRAPLGSIASSHSTNYGSGGAPLGLGAWELGGGFALAYTTQSALGIWLSTEAGYRLPDEALRRLRQLGTRWDTQLGARIDVWSWLKASLALQARLTGDASISGRRLEGTSQRLVTVVLGVSANHASSGFRSGVGLSIDPPLSGLSAGAASTMALSYSLGFAR